MQNPLSPMALFDTPSSVEDLQEWIMRLSGSERSLAMTVAGMSWNLAAHIVDQELAKEAA